VTSQLPDLCIIFNLVAPEVWSATSAQYSFAFSLPDSTSCCCAVLRTPRIQPVAEGTAKSCSLVFDSTALLPDRWGLIYPFGDPDLGWLQELYSCQTSSVTVLLWLRQRFVMLLRRSILLCSGCCTQQAVAMLFYGYQGCNQLLKVLPRVPCLSLLCFWLDGARPKP